VCKKTECQCVDGGDLTGTLHIFRVLILSVAISLSLAAVKTNASEVATL